MLSEREIAKLLRSVAHETRMTLLFHLASKEASSFSGLMRELGLTSGRLDFHLKILRNVGLVYIDDSGRYRLTELGRWVVTRIRELSRVFGKRRRPALVNYRGIVKDASFAKLSIELSGRYSSEVEEVVAKVYSQLSAFGEPVSEEALMMISEVELRRGVDKYVCLPSSAVNYVVRSYISREYEWFRESFCRDLSYMKALSLLSPTLYSYQLKGLVVVKDPVFAISGASAVFLRLDRDLPLLKVVSKLNRLAGEIVVLTSHEIDADTVALLEELLPPGKLTIVLENEAPLLGSRNIGIVFHSENGWSEVPPEWVKAINSPVPHIVSRGSRVTSVSLIESEVPDEGAYVVPVCAAVPLTRLYLESERNRVDAYQVIDDVAMEITRVAQRGLRQLAAVLKKLVGKYEFLQPQLALTGFEAAMRMHHGSLNSPRLAALANRFWKSLSSTFQEVRVTAVLVDDKLYPLASSDLFNPLSSLALSIKRGIEEYAALEGTVQMVLEGGSLWPLTVRTYIPRRTIRRILSLAKNSGVTRLSFHLEFTACEACGLVSRGAGGVCSSCLSSNVVHLVRPLLLYRPRDVFAAEVLKEYSSRLTVEELLEKH